MSGCQSELEQADLDRLYRSVDDALADARYLRQERDDLRAALAAARERLLAVTAEPCPNCARLEAREQETKQALAETWENFQRVADECNQMEAERDDLRRKLAAAREALDRALAASCYGCARGIDEHWWVCREIRASLIDDAQAVPSAPESGQRS